MLLDRFAKWVCIPMLFILIPVIISQNRKTEDVLKKIEQQRKVSNREIRELRRSLQAQLKAELASQSEAPINVSMVIVQHRMTKSEIEVLAKTIYAEAANQSPSGRKAVASVIWNRAHKNPKKVYSVCLAPSQFSCWNNQRPSSFRVRNSDRVYQECLRLAEEVSVNNFRPLGNWTHYYNPRKANPDWRHHLRYKSVIGDHVFGTL
jgi:spore germination cell wall hydrolase CwlJ-like protein